MINLGVRELAPAFKGASKLPHSKESQMARGNFKYFWLGLHC